MEQRQSDDLNETRKTAPSEPKSEDRPADIPSANAKPQAGSHRNAPPREGGPSANGQREQRQQPQRDNRQPHNRQRDENTVPPRMDQNAGPQNAGPRNANPRQTGPRNAALQDANPSDAGSQDRPSRANGPRDANPRQATAPDPKLQDRGSTDRGSIDRSSSDNAQNQRPDQRANDRQNGQRDRQNNTTERETATRDSASRNNQPPQMDRTDRDPANPERPAREPGAPERLIIGISLGDYNGIGPEVILKALQYNRLQKLCTPVIYGSMRVLNRYRNLLNLKDWNLNGSPSIAQISHKMTNVITCWPDQSQDIQPGHVTPDAGQAAFACLQRAVEDLKAGKLDALVTAPINKYNIQSEEFKFPGHTEYLAEAFDVQDNLMFMVSERLRVGVVTGHVPLGRVRQNVTKERISQKLTLMMQSLRQDFGIDKPKIAVLGLNPHAGEEGLLGNEEQEIIKPLIDEWRTKGQLVFGPYPADGFFGTRAYSKFDAVLAMYHDQGLIPFKSIAFEEGVNFTAGMPAVRTSPDHGTAYDIAGKNLADETSMLQAIYTAIDVARQRKEFLELEANALAK